MLRFRHELLAQQVQRCFGGDEQTAAVVALMMQLSRQQTSLEQVRGAFTSWHGAMWSWFRDGIV